MSKPIFTRRRLCRQFGGIIRVWYIASNEPNDYFECLPSTNKQIEYDKRPELINRKVVIFQQDNSRLHTSLGTGQKLKELGYELLMHSAYSNDLALLDQHLFGPLRNTLYGEAKTGISFLQIKARSSMSVE